MEFIIEHRAGLFVVGTVFFLIISRKPLQNMSSHGFYRFFAFEGIWALVCLNVPFWFLDPFSLQHLLSWLLLACSCLLVVHGLYLLKSRGGVGRENAQFENYSFENTVNLVDSGVYRYIRHPMYSSLLLLAWGTFFKHISVLAVLIVALVTCALMITAKKEEEENCQFFGEAYDNYMKRSHMFIPHVF